MDPNVPSGQPVQRSAPQQPSTPTPPSITPNQGAPKRLSKKILIVAVIVLVVIIGAIAVFTTNQKQISQIILQQPQQDELNVNSPQKTFTLPDGTLVNSQDVAQESIQFVEYLRQPDGSYEYLYDFEELCTENSDCPFGTEEYNMRVNGWTALGYFGQSMITNKEENLAKANRDLQNLFVWCEGRENECLWMLVQPALIYKQTQDEAVKNFVVENAARLSSQPLAENEMIAGIEARELALAYDLSGDINFLNSANRRLTHAENLLASGSNIYYDKDGYFFSQYTCWTTLGMIEIDRVQNTSQNIANAIAFLDSAKIYENIKYFTFPSEIQPCIESYYLLGDTTGDEKFYQEGDKIMDKFISHFFNNSNSGKGGTYFYNNLSDPFTAKKYMIASDVSYTNYLLGLYHK